MVCRPQEEEWTAMGDDAAQFVEEDDGGSVSVGWVFHAAMSAKARLGWLLSLAYGRLVASSPTPRTSSFERQEPNLGGRAAPSIAPQADEDFADAEQEEDEEKAPPTPPPPKQAPPSTPPAKPTAQVER